MDFQAACTHTSGDVCEGVISEVSMEEGRAAGTFGDVTFWAAILDWTKAGGKLSSSVVIQLLTVDTT